MRAWRTVALVLAIASGCHGGGHADCSSAVGGAVDRMVADARAHGTAKASEAAQRLAPAMTRVLTAACVEDRWPGGVVACVDRAGTRAELDACDRQLTPAQRDAERKRMDEVVTLSL